MTHPIKISLGIIIAFCFLCGCSNPKLPPQATPGPGAEAEILSLAGDLAWKTKCLRLLQSGDTNQVRMFLRSSLTAKSIILERYLEENPKSTNAAAASAILQSVNSVLGSTNRTMSTKETIQRMNETLAK